MASLTPFIRRRFLCSSTTTNVSKKWAVKEVTKSNFSESLVEFKDHLSSSDFVAVSLQKTGSYRAPWHRPQPFDTADTSYCKAKYAAERFQLLQFAACPFTLRASKLTPYPYNFVLFPRDELKMGMPTYSFSVQASHLTSMADEGFDFNACIYNGISYLSRAQESAAKARIGNPTTSSYVMSSSSTPTVADTVFVERIKSRVKHWKSACKNTKKDNALLSSLRKIVMGSEIYGTRPCMNLDVCSERQVQLALEMLKEFSDELVPLIIPARGGGTQAVRVVLTSSTADKDLFERELQNLEEEQNKRVRGFREVIDLISASQKPVVSHNSLNDFTVIHSEFLSPLPTNVDEFMGSLHSVFTHILDVTHLMKNIGPLRKMTNISAAISYLNNHYFAPIDMEILPQESEGNIHRHNVVKMCYLFAKLCSILKISDNSMVFNKALLAPAIEEYTNISNPCSDSPQESTNEDIRVWTKNMRKVSCDQLVFLWGFRSGMTAGMIKSLLCKSHAVFSEEFDVRLVDKSCAIVVFWRHGLSETFLDAMSREEICDSLMEIASEGIRASSYETYKRVCRLGLWEADLAESLDKALEDLDYLAEVNSATNSKEIYWSSNSAINFDDL
ncbi:poly(A)-specific ribonuclease PARN-like [Pyrus x bretschneideri]|uniref:poly(A)-specific ribonuclease PARN-like n=1 Tax=Pyrus x bretschneideri TaxID=225117 RepID=UPI00202DC098|nr:poly(A)-specific ribonuclease PARN-like [Pyrus x bretschneideri]